MTVQAAKEIAQRELNQDRNSLEHIRVFRVVTTSSSDSETDVLNADGLPALGDEHPSADGAILQRRIVRTEHQLPSGGATYQVSCRYTTRPLGALESQPGDPVSFAPECQWTYDLIEMPVETGDFLGTRECGGELQVGLGFEQPIVNSAGQPFQTVYTQEVPSLGLVFTRNELTYNPLDALWWGGKVNQSPVTILGITFDTETVLVRKITAQPQYTPNGFEYQRVTYDLKFDINKHHLEVIDSGTSRLNGDELDVIRDKSKNVVVDPVPLDGQGQPLTLPVGEDNRSVLLVWRTRKLADLNQLQLPV